MQTHFILFLVREIYGQIESLTTKIENIVKVVFNLLLNYIYTFG
jgi:hypothetical protein